MHLACVFVCRVASLQFLSASAVPVRSLAECLILGLRVVWAAGVRGASVLALVRARGQSCMSWWSCCRIVC